MMRCWWIGLICLLGSGCQNLPAQQSDQRLPLHNTVGVSFAENGVLWRVVPTSEHIWVDSSTDNGKTFGTAVKVNPQAQKISASPEDPPQIVIGHSGNVYVLYSADDQQKATTFFSVSTDSGRSFSPAALVSDHADQARNYMDALLLDRNEKLYVFWHDQRHELANGSLSLYYTSTNTPEVGQFINHVLSNDICSCCRTAVALAPDNQPVLLARMVFPENVRDHALLKLEDSAAEVAPQRVSWDSRSLDACPEQGPALAVDGKGRSHMVWFSLGENQQGIFYAYSDDYGKTVSPPKALGNPQHLAAHPDIFTNDHLSILIWQEFDGTHHRVYRIMSTDRGERWSQPVVLAETLLEAGQSKLIGNGQQVFLSWVQGNRHKIIEIK